MAAIEVFADVRCPFTHLALRRLVDGRAALGRAEVGLWVRAWPLELVNDAPLDPAMIGEEVEALRAQVAPELFTGFDLTRFPSSSLPGLVLAATAYGQSRGAGERVSLALRDALFEGGRDIADEGVLVDIAAAAGVELPAEGGREQVLADWGQGRRRGVVGSPHFFVGGDGFFCPSLDISRVDGALRITDDRASFDALMALYFHP